jgi:hypothetical protein
MNVDKFLGAPPLNMETQVMCFLSPKFPISEKKNNCHRTSTKKEGEVE